MKKSIPTLLVLLLSLFAASAHAQVGVIQARVTEAQSGRPLADVQLSVDGLTVGGRSGANGQVVLTGVPAGRQTLAAERVGYGVTRQTIQVRAGETTTLTIRLSQQAVSLSGVTVIGQQGGYVTSAASTAGNL